MKSPVVIRIMTTGLFIFTALTEFLGRRCVLTDKYLIAHIEVLMSERGKYD
jgi:hypothetical protein